MLGWRTAISVTCCSPSGTNGASSFWQSLSVILSISALKETLLKRHLYLCIPHLWSPNFIGRKFFKNYHLLNRSSNQTLAHLRRTSEKSRTADADPDSAKGPVCVSNTWHVTRDFLTRPTDRIQKIHRFESLLDGMRHTGSRARQNRRLCQMTDPACRFRAVGHAWRSEGRERGLCAGNWFCYCVFAEGETGEAACAT